MSRQPYRTQSDTLKLQRLIDVLKERGSDLGDSLEKSSAEFLGDVKQKPKSVAAASSGGATDALTAGLPHQDDDDDAGSSFEEEAAGASCKEDDWGSDWEVEEDGATAASPVPPVPATPPNTPPNTAAIQEDPYVKKPDFFPCCVQKAEEEEVEEPQVMDCVQEEEEEPRSSQPQPIQENSIPQERNSINLSTNKLPRDLNLRVERFYSIA
jgi:hypothetical protein